MVDLLNRRKLQNSDTVDVPTRAQWAAYLGITRETLSRALAKMRENKLIETDKKAINILDVQALKDTI